MKKILVLSLMLVLSGCACFDGMCGDDEETATPVANAYRGYNPEKRIQNRPVYNQPQDYSSRQDIYVYEKPQPRRIIYRQAEPQIIYVKQTQPAPAPKPIIVEAPKPAPVVVTPKVTTVENTTASCGDIKTTTNESTLPSTTSPCPSKVKEVREPVEIVYKKTTYKTTYEPKTTTTVTYEKQPYKQVKEVVVQETQTAPNTVETITTTTTTTTSQENLDVMPADEIK